MAPGTRTRSDYPPICLDVARAVADGRAARGIVPGSSGQGEQIAAAERALTTGSRDGA
jgi:ribose 5-phosphate isomerase RpiB